MCGRLSSRFSFVLCALKSLELLVDAALIASLSNVAYGKTVAEVRRAAASGIDLECVNFQTVTNKLSPQWAVLSGAGCVYVLFRGRKSGIDTLVSSLLSTAELIVPAAHCTCMRACCGTCCPSSVRCCMTSPVRCSRVPSALWSLVTRWVAHTHRSLRSCCCEPAGAHNGA